MLKLQRIEQGLLFLTLLFLPTQLGKHFWPNFSYIYSLPIDYLSPTLYFWDLLVVLLLIIFTIQRKSVRRGALNLFLFFFLSQALSLVPYVLDGDSINLGAGLVRAQQYLIAGLFGVYIASINFAHIKSIIFYSLGLGVLFESSLAILQFSRGSTIGLWFLGERSFSLSTPGIAKFDYLGLQFLRPYATFPHPNVLAAILLLSLIIMKNSLFENRFLMKIVLSIATIFASITILLTFSRAAIIATFTSALILFGKKERIILFLVTFFLLPVLYTRFSTVLNFDNLSLIRREQLTEVALSIWSTSPFLGIGLNNFITISSDQIVAGPSRFLQPVHNIFLLSLSETGIIGLIGLLILIVCPILRSFRYKGFLLPWLIIIFLGMFDHYFLTLPAGYRMLFVVWGLSFAKD